MTAKTRKVVSGVKWQCHRELEGWLKGKNNQNLKNIFENTNANHLLIEEKQ